MVLVWLFHDCADWSVDMENISGFVSYRKEKAGIKSRKRSVSNPPCWV